MLRSTKLDLNHVFFLEKKRGGVGCRINSLHDRLEQNVGRERGGVIVGLFGECKS